VDAICDGGLRLLTGEDVASLLAGRELEVLDAVARAYVAHGRGESTLPNSVFLRFPADELNRIIALPAFLGGSFDLAGVKWIASFPGNTAYGIERASAVVILNSLATGRPYAVLEGSLISAQRTAASAALAARALLQGTAPGAVGVIGAGIINRQIVHFLRVVLPDIRRFVLYDRQADRAAALGAKLEQSWPGVEVANTSGVEPLIEECQLVSYATTALRPHVDDLSRCPPGAVHLHVSLRDLTPEAILTCDNVVDDADHVCRAQTSVHLAEQLAGSRDFIRCSLAELLEGTAPPKDDRKPTTVFSPFGLGVLDLAVARLVFEEAASHGKGMELQRFFPPADA
jgi:ornithine cyclodeaminase